MKTCFKCGDTKPLDDFYRHPQMGDGRLNKCKTCNKEDARRDYWRKKPDVEWLGRERERGRKKYWRYYARWPEEQRRAPLTDSEKRLRVVANNALGNAVRDGRVTKPCCCRRCGSEPASWNLHGHHHDYSKPLDVEWICLACHAREHRAASTRSNRRSVTDDSNTD